MSKNSISAGLVSKLHFKMTMMAVDESSDLMGEVAEVAYHLSLHNCRGVVTSLLHLGLFSLYVPERSFMYRKMPIFRTPTVIMDKPGGFTAFLATGKVIDKYKMLKLLN
jgi:hypothetical protein